MKTLSRSIRPLTLICLIAIALPVRGVSQTVVAIRGEQFLINGEPTYKGTMWNGYPIEGLLFNSRMVQGIFDDMNPETRSLWQYPDTKTWDPERNTNEFLAAMQEWRDHGLLAFTLNLQGGSPTGYGNKGWINSAFDPHGDLRHDYCVRLDRILKKADDLGMVVILGLFYFGQDQHLVDEAAVVRATDAIMQWLFESGHKNLIIEINNECDVAAYDHAILRPDRVHELIERVRQKEKHGFRFLAGTSYKGCSIPTRRVAEASDLILIHGNGASNPDIVADMVSRTRQILGDRRIPIVFNEDDHFEFDKPRNNFIAAVQSYASWGFFDYRLKGESDVRQGYQSVPVDWRISSDRKKGFFRLLREITGGQ
jgi:hypothetical protein